MNAQHIKSSLNPKLVVTAFPGHFATSHCHNSHYIDITRIKHEHMMAREAAVTLALRYSYTDSIDTIVCMDGSEVIGAFLARHLAKRFCEIGWAQGLWDLCGESVFILPEACEFRVAPRPVFDEKGEILYLAESRTMVAVNKNDHERIAADSRIRINGHK